MMSTVSLLWQMGGNILPDSHRKKIKKNIKTNTMKKIILTSLIVLVALVTSFAQSSAPVTLNVKLNAIQSIVASSPTVNLEYKTIEDYSTGVSSTINDHLKVYSTGGFIVKVSSSVNDLTSNKGNETIASSGISVIASKGTTSLTPTYASAINLSQTITPLITSTTGGVNENFKVSYTAAGGNAYVNKFFKGTDAAAATVYTTTVTYSIEAN